MKANVKATARLKKKLLMGRSDGKGCIMGFNSEECYLTLLLPFGQCCFSLVMEVDVIVCENPPLPSLFMITIMTKEIYKYICINLQIMF